jgi:hypothetical protein
MHALGDDASLFGASDGYSTQMVPVSLIFFFLSYLIGRMNLNTDNANTFTLRFTRARDTTNVR